MPEELITTTHLQLVLGFLEDNTLNKATLSRRQSYYSVQNVLNSETEISNVVIERLLAVCLNDLQNEQFFSKQYCFNILNIIIAITRRIKAGNLPTPKDLYQTLLAILNKVKISPWMFKVENLQELCFETVSSFPDSILIEVVTSNSVEITEIINLYCNQGLPWGTRLLPCGLILKLLNVTPKEKRITFVKENLKLWFTKLIPTIVAYIQGESLNTKPLDTLEALTDNIIIFDYSEDAYWLCVLECIYNPQKYPLVMKQMLENGSKTWHRLWIVFIRLLKTQITRSNNPIGSPINSMLPVVEMAFKMDVTNRCRAFQCWNVLIDNFHTETNEVYVVKRLKLLIIPLKSNNAKVEETALAKLNTWWYLIYRFQTRLEKFVDSVLISFLHFSFGKYVPQKQSFVPGLLTNSTKKRAVEAFIEMAGHLSCAGCVDMPKLSGRIITKKVLVDYWNDWVYSLKMAISIASENVGVTQQQISCVWKSFVFIISELPDNNVRKDLFDELLSVLNTVLQDGHSNSLNVVIDLTRSLFDDETIIPLLKAKGDQAGPLIKIITMLLKPTFNVYYRSNHTKEVILKLKPVTKCVIDGTVCPPERIIHWMLLSPDLPQDNISYLWTALSESLLEQQRDNIINLDTLLLWPLKSPNFFADVSHSSFVWYRLFEYVYPKLTESVTKNIYSLSLFNDMTNYNIILKLYASIVILKQTLAKDCVSDYEKQVELLMEVTNRIEDYKQLEKICSMLVEVIVNVLKKHNILLFKVKLAKNTMKCVKNVLKLMTTALEKNDVLDNYSSILENLLTQVNTCYKFFDNKTLSVCTLIVTDELVKLSSLLDKWPSTKKSLLSVLKTCLSNINEGNRTFNDIKTAIDNIESNNETNTVVEKSLTGNKFNTPDLKIITRKAKKKELGIVSTVVENGEEFIVVKSNWKFNPRKLTENQKEKFQRKREDIPALYQDLSQSQDEFKIKPWKTDSQDASSTNSKSTTTSKSNDVEDVTNILKNIPSSDVVPKIIETMFSDHVKKVEIENAAVVNPSTASPNSLNVKSITKEAKSPRMALKDRVFKNVRNLIEKSGVQKESKELSESLVKFENIPKTPSSKTNDNVNLVNSAPPVINIERPSRLKRKPRKFEDVEIFALKRNRRSLSHCESPPDNVEQHLQNDSKETCKENDDNVPKGDESDTKSLCKPSDDSNQNVQEKSELLTAEIKAFDEDIVVNDQSHLEVVINTDQKEYNIDVEKDHPVCIGVENESVFDKIASNTLTDSVENVEMSDNAACSEQVKEVINKIVQEVHIEENSKTPNTSKKQEPSNQKPSAKKGSAKKSRIEKELAIDTVEGHPLLKIHSEKRVTRKNVTNKILSANNSRRKSLTDKLNKLKSDTKSSSKSITPNMKKKDKAPSSCELDTVSRSVRESQEDSQRLIDTPDDIPLSEDIIESSQDSTFTGMTLTSTKNSIKKLSVVIEKVPLHASKRLPNNVESNKSSSCHKTDNLESNDDSDFPQNKTAPEDTTNIEATEDMETEPMDDKIIEINENSSDVIIINDDEEAPIVINTEDTAVGSDTQEIAEADTLPTDPLVFVESKIMKDKVMEKNDNSIVLETLEVEKESNESSKQNLAEVNTADDITETILDISEKTDDELNTASSPFKDEDQRKQDFLDNTLEISPIKTMSPERNKKSPSPETSSDYVVIKLSSPVQSNGEPFEKCDSPEIFTEDKVSPDKMELSPPREEISVNYNGSPSSSLSLKKNRPQVRSGGRAAQMLGLCVPDRMQSIMNSDRTEAEEPKKSSPSSTPARRNLRILYNSVGDSSENSEDNEDSENFLKFKKCLPTSDCSPSGPILKRKLVEITDEATISPASKRKRVSFHDPPVSTTIAVQKYIEPLGVRSPQNSAHKRLERQSLRSQTTLKSAKKLDSVFKLDSVLTKAVQSFSDGDRTSTDDTQSMSLDETPAVEIVKSSDLNDTDPICLELKDCNDPIDNIAGDLSSPTMKTVFLKELEGKITTIGDLAKMTELEVNRLCIKAPKIQIAKKVLDDYASKKAAEQSVHNETIAKIIIMDEVCPEVICTTKMDVESQTNDTVSVHTETQTDVPTSVEMEMCHSGIQTEESGDKSTGDIIATCIAERPDFVELLSNNLEDSSKLQIAETLQFSTLTDAFMKKVTNTNSKTLLTRIIEKQNEPGLTDKQRELTFLQDYLCDRFDSRDLILFCSRILAKIHQTEKPL